LKDLAAASKRLLPLWRHSPLGLGLPPLFRYKTTNNGAAEEADRRFAGFEGFRF